MHGKNKNTKGEVKKMRNIEMKEEEKNEKYRVYVFFKQIKQDLTF